MAARVFFARADSMKRNDVLTGSFTGPAGAAVADEACAKPRVAPIRHIANAQNTTKDGAKIRFTGKPPQNVQKFG
jgi:hypothetical protein